MKNHPLRTMTTWFFMILGSCLISQGFTIPERETDSLKKALLNGRKDTATVNTLYRLFWAYRRSNLDSAFKYASHGLSLSRDIRYREGTANHLYALGIVHKARGDFDEAVDLFSKATIAYDEAEKPSGLISCITELAAINMKQGHYEKSLEYLHHALQQYGDTIPKERLSRIYSMMGGIYSALEQNLKALEYHFKSLEINKKENIEIGISVNYNNIGNVYQNMGRYDEAIKNFLESKTIKEKLGDKYGLATLYNNLGTCYLAMKNYSKAIEHHQKTLELFTEMGDEHGIALGLVNLGVDFIEAGNPSRAIEYELQAIETAQEQNLLELLAEASVTLANAYSAVGNYKEAFKYQRQHEAYSDSLMNREVMETISSLENRFELENKEKEIALLNAEKEKQDLKLQKRTMARNLMVITFLLSIIVLVLLYSSFRGKQRINKKLKEINETKSRFFANIAHEFRTPLTLLIGPLENLINHPEKRDPEIIRMMYRNANRLLILNNQLMDLSKLEAGTLKLNLNKSDIISAAKGMVMSFESLAEYKEIKFFASFPKDPIRMFFDRDKLEKIIYNLLSNAFKFTGKGGEVKFIASVAQPHKVDAASKKLRKNASKILVLKVSDTGKGIESEETERIFERFYQVDAGHKRSYEGTGLGLAIAKEMVEMHKGFISVKSNKGEGSVFSVYLPMDDEAYPPESKRDLREETDAQEISTLEISKFPSAGDPEESPEPAEKIQPEPLILVVEDNNDMRTFIMNSLNDQYLFIEAADGEEGLARAAEKVPDLIITDLMMPKMDGVELCEKLKTDERTSHIPVIMLTALATVEHRIKGLETGADDYFTKPFNSEELSVRCHNLIEQRKKLRDKFRKDGYFPPDEKSVTSADHRFMDKMMDAVEKHLANPELDVEMMVTEIGMSRSQLHRKIKALTGQSTTEFIRNIRLKKAANLLKKDYGSVAEVCYAVGFNSLSYFTRCFHEVFGVSPSGYKEAKS